jgi:SAM-dependent methyltransferase
MRQATGPKNDTPSADIKALGLTLPVGHYTGEEGQRYFAYQSRFADITAQLIARKFAKHIRPSDVVLDFGCGGGFVLKTITCRQRFGIEVNPLARQVATENGLACFETLHAIEDSTVDIVISHHSLEHVPSPLQSLREIEPKLKPGGLLLIVVPIDDWRTQREYDSTDMNHHLYTWTPLLLGHLLYESGFETSTLSITIGINGWFRGFHRYYRSIPQPFFDALSYTCGVLRKTREIFAVVGTPRIRGDREQNFR